MSESFFYSNAVATPEIKLYPFQIFDIDGTLVDIKFGYLKDLFNKIKRDLPKAKFPKNEQDFDDLIKQIWYEQGRNELMRERLEIEPLEFWNAFRRYDSPDARKDNLIIYEDIFALLKLKEKGVKIAALSDSPVKITELESEFIEKYLGDFKFDYVLSVGHESGRNRKPHFEGLGECISILGANTLIDHNILYTGNSPRADILQAHNYNEYVSNLLKQDSELLFNLQVPLGSTSPLAVVNVASKPVDSALIIRPNAQYVMKDIIDKNIYKNVEKLGKLKPDFIITSLKDLVP